MPDLKHVAPLAALTRSDATSLHPGRAHHLISFRSWFLALTSLRTPSHLLLLIRTGEAHLHQKPSGMLCQRVRVLEQRWKAGPDPAGLRLQGNKERGGSSMPATRAPNPRASFPGKQAGGHRVAPAMQQEQEAQVCGTKPAASKPDDKFVCRSRSTAKALPLKHHPDSWQGLTEGDMSGTDHDPYWISVFNIREVSPRRRFVFSALRAACETPGKGGGSREEVIFGSRIILLLLELLGKEENRC